jgi:hypothetical protein
MGCIAVEDCTFLVGGLEGLKGVHALASFGLNHRRRTSLAFSQVCACR